MTTSIKLPSFSEYGYEVQKQLGVNPSGGRVTYLASEIGSGKQFVIKQFQFVQGADWSGFKAIEREIEVLKSLDHRGIPKYLSSFETTNGVCLIQEYKNAQPLTVTRSYSDQQIKLIARSVLEILNYLQSLHPPVLHRDVQPGNILMDEKGVVYLVDFGFARIGGNNIAASSMVVGTMGFMAPEEMLGREITPAADLYGLGATLICLLTGTPSGEIGRLINENFRFDFDANIDEDFQNWIQQMVEPNLSARFKNSQEALKYFCGSIRKIQPNQMKRADLERQPDTDNTVDWHSVCQLILMTAFSLSLTLTALKTLGINNQTIPDLINAIQSSKK